MKELIEKIENEEDIEEASSKWYSIKKKKKVILYKDDFKNESFWTYFLDDAGVPYGKDAKVPMPKTLMMVVDQVDYREK